MVEAAHTEADQLECGEVQAGHQLAPMLVAKGKAAATELHQHQCLHQTASTTSSQPPAPATTSSIALYEQKQINEKEVKECCGRELKSGWLYADG